MKKTISLTENEVIVLNILGEHAEKMEKRRKERDKIFYQYYHLCFDPAYGV